MPYIYDVSMVELLQNADLVLQQQFLLLVAELNFFFHKDLLRFIILHIILLYLPKRKLIVLHLNQKARIHILLFYKHSALLIH